MNVPSAGGAPIVCQLIPYIVGDESLAAESFTLFSWIQTHQFTGFSFRRYQGL